MVFLLDIGITIAGIYTGIILYKKKKYAPIAAMIFIVIFSIGIFLMEQSRFQKLSVLVVGPSLLWLIYFIASKRVKEVYYGENSGSDK